MPILTSINWVKMCIESVDYKISREKKHRIREREIGKGGRGGGIRVKKTIISYIITIHQYINLKIVLTNYFLLPSKCFTHFFLTPNTRY